MIAERLHEVWYGDDAPGVVLRGLEGVYSRLREWDRRRQLAARAPDLVGRPIVVVGNLVAGGTGKTPLVIRLCDLLQSAGQRVGVISRGHGRRSRTPVSVNSDSDPADSGDEPLLIATRCGIPVRVDTDREAAARHLFGLGVTVLIADDGLQRERLPRALELCVVDAARGFGNGHLLPAGPLRESLARLDTVDWVVRQGEGDVAGLPADCVDMRLSARAFRQLDTGRELSMAVMKSQLAGRRAYAVAGIGHPERFFSMLRESGIVVERTAAFPDHHVFANRDFADMDGVILMTEKDAVKCRELGLDDAWCLPVDAVLPEAFEQDFLARVGALVKARP